MLDEYGPPIPVNGKRPDWLGDDQEFRVAGCDAQFWTTPLTRLENVEIQLPADHPYYQSAEYKASVGEDAPFEINPNPDPIAEAIALLEAPGHTVTPPDPLAADREFLAGIYDVWGMPEAAAGCRGGSYDERIAPLMEYLRKNKGRL